MTKSVFRAGRWVALTAAGMFALQACGGGGGGSSSPPTPPPPPPPPPANRAPVISSPAALSVSEGITGVVYTLQANDPDGDPMTFEMTGGPDAGVFSFNGANRTLSVAVPLAFDNPRDANGDNVYVVNFRVSDNRGASATIVVEIRVQAGGFASMTLRRVGSGFSAPLFVTGIPGTGRVVVLQKDGLARVLNPANGAIETTHFINVSSQISTDDERGLLGMAFSPNFATDRSVYLNLINRSGNTEIRRYRTVSGSSTQLDPSTIDVIMTIQQNNSFHNGGWIGFGNDGLLYLATGDGGSGSSQNAQDPNSLNGKILRIDVSGDDFPNDDNRDYRIPAGNAFPGGNGGAPEIFALGLRNPWRSSFDRVTGDLFIADVGQSAIEEINRMRPSADSGVNYGWDVREGTQTHNGANRPEFTNPVAEYSHPPNDRAANENEGKSITGGYVYRGNIAPIRDHYLFADFITGNIWSVPVTSLTVGQTVRASQFNHLNASLVPDAGSLGAIASFGRGNDGEIYIVDIGGDIFRIEGAP